MKFFGWGIAGKLKRSKIRRGKIFLLKMMPKNSVCAEIGVFRGEFSTEILKQVNPKQLYLIDPWKYYEQAIKGIVIELDRWSQEKQDQRYQLVKKKFNDNPCVNIIKDESEIALESFPDNFFDWVYIDGDHSMEAVLKDLKLSLKKVKSGGYITGDDMSFDEDASNTKKSVAKAVTSFLNTAPVELIQTKNYQFIIKVKK